jgi:hypothetical protein
VRLAGVRTCFVYQYFNRSASTSASASRLLFFHQNNPNVKILTCDMSLKWFGIIRLIAVEIWIIFIALLPGLKIK